MPNNISVRFQKKLIEYTEESGMFSRKKVKYPTLIVDLHFSDLYRAAIQQMNLGDYITLITYELTDDEYDAAKTLERLYPNDPKRKASLTVEFGLRGFIVNNPLSVKAHYFHTLDKYIGQIKTALEGLDNIIQSNLPGFNDKEQEEEFKL